MEQTLAKIIADKSQVEFIIKYLKDNREITTVNDLKSIYKNKYHYNIRQWILPSILSQSVYGEKGKVAIPLSYYMKQSNGRQSGGKKILNIWVYL